MWKMFGLKTSPTSDPSEPEITQEVREMQLRSELSQKMRLLTKMYQQSESLFNRLNEPIDIEKGLDWTIKELIDGIEGSAIILSEVKSDYDTVKIKLKDHERLKQMVDNHQSIVSALQDNHSNEISSLFEKASKKETQFERQISALRQQKQELSLRLGEKQHELRQISKENLCLRSEVQQLQRYNKLIEAQMLHWENKYSAVAGHRNQPRKTISLDNLELQHIFYYSRIKSQICLFLGIKDISHLVATNKFFYSSLRKIQPWHVSFNLKKLIQTRQDREAENIRQYSKIFELFPSENIKANAIKYLHFKIKPASYMLPYLQEQQAKEEPQKKNQRFSWRNIFHSHSESKPNQEKFSIALLKNQDQFQKAESRIESLFRNILQFKMPEDLEDFSATMQKQLRELKQQLGQSRGKGGQGQWTAQLLCLSRYMYYQMGQLFNLLLVIFGELLSKNRQVLKLRQDNEYLCENEIVLRNLIQNLAGDKTAIEKKLLVLENDILLNKLEKEAAVHQSQTTITELQSIQSEFNRLKQENQHYQSTLSKCHQQYQTIQDNMSAIRSEIQTLEKNTRSRQSSLSSEERA